MSKPNKPERDTCCANCHWWNETTETQDESRNGECRAMPPVPLYDPDNGAFTIWPFTEAEHWCGVFAPRLQ